MRILLINVPHLSIGSRIPDDHLPPLGLLAVGGPLIDDGHEVRLVDGEFGPMPTAEIVAEAVGFAPDIVMFGHSGSTSGHPVIAEVSRAIATALLGARIVYGGVFPTYHWREILAAEPHVDAIVRGEGEETALRLVAALRHGTPLARVAGIAFRDGVRPVATPAAAVIRDLDAYRVGWELIDHALQLLGRAARRRGAVLARLPASLQLLRPARPRWPQYRVFLNPDRGLRHAMLWYTKMGRRVWPHEILGFLRDPLVKSARPWPNFGGRRRKPRKTRWRRAHAPPRRRAAIMGPLPRTFEISVAIGRGGASRSGHNVRGRVSECAGTRGRKGDAYG